MTLLSFLAVGCCLGAAFADETTFESCQYASDAAARAVWQPMRESAPVAAATDEKAVRLPCNFAGTTMERASWDLKTNLDLTGCRGIQFSIRCKDVSPVSSFSIYMKSGDGWYSTSFFPESTNEWCVVNIDKSSTRTEGKPAGWSKISAVRVSAWRGKNVDTEMLVRDFQKTGVLGRDAVVAVLRADSVGAKQREEMRSVDTFCEGMVESLRLAGVGSALISDLDVTADRLKAAKLVVLPHNPNLPAPAAEALQSFIGNGGKLLIFYTLPPALEKTVGIERGAFVRANADKKFATIRFTKDALPGAPNEVSQRSWNIHSAKAVEGKSRVLAEWFDEKGSPTGNPALVGSSNCIFMTHVLLNDDPVRKRRMLLAMSGSLVPEIWQRAAGNAMAEIGKLGQWKTIAEAKAAIAAEGKKDPRVAGALRKLSKLCDTAEKKRAAGDFAASLDAAQNARQQLVEAFCMAQKPQRGEFRAFWCHSAFGVDGMEWDEAISRLARAGFTAILPNMLWGGSAFYPSEVLPLATKMGDRGDQIAACLAACRKHGVQIHVWKVNWNTGHNVPADFIERMRREGRLQASQQGKEEPWLCPSHPANRDLEIAAMVEVARKYDVDGIHFDYIRYPDGNHCFCTGCRERFSKAANVTIEKWPADVLKDGPLRQKWLDFRRDNITAVVRAVSEQARVIRPKIKISAAVFRNWSTDRDGVGQDWKLWCDRGWLDFVCPMDYTESDRQFDTWLGLQKEWAGKVPVYPGIGVSTSHSRLSAEHAIAQIQITRRQNMGGFTIFNYGVTESRDLLPLLSLGITRK